MSGFYKYSVIGIILVLSLQSLAASSGEGISVRVGNCKIAINWPWHEQFNQMSSEDFIATIRLLGANYNTLAALKEQYNIECLYDEVNRVFKIIHYRYDEKTTGAVFEKAQVSGNELVPTINTLLIQRYKLKPPKDECTLYVVFIPAALLEPDSDKKVQVYQFLQKSEVYLAHDAALQTNYQGYVYSIFFNWDSMQSSLKMLDPGIAIINKKVIYENSLDTLNIVRFH